MLNPFFEEKFLTLEWAKKDPKYSRSVQNRSFKRICKEKFSGFRHETKRQLVMNNRAHVFRETFIMTPKWAQ